MGTKNTFSGRKSKKEGKTELKNRKSRVIYKVQNKMVKINTKTTSRMPIWEFLWTIHLPSKTTVTNKQNQPFRGSGNCPKSMYQMKKHFKKIEYISVKTAKSRASESQPALLPTPPCLRKLPSGWVQAGMQGFLSPQLPIGLGYLSRGIVHLHFSYLISVLQKLWNKQEQLRGLGSISYTKHPLTEQKFYHSRQARNTGIPTVLAQLGHRVKFPQQEFPPSSHVIPREGSLSSLPTGLQGKWQTIRREFLKLSPRGLTLFGTQGEEVKAWRHYQKH